MTYVHKTDLWTCQTLEEFYNNLKELNEQIFHF